MSQQSQILTHLKQNKTLTAIEALQLYGVFRLAARIGELRQSHEILTHTITQGDKRFAKYELRTS